jgi:hypothetical protein
MRRVKLIKGARTRHERFNVLHGLAKQALEQGLYRESTSLSDAVTGLHYHVRVLKLW